MSRWIAVALALVTPAVADAASFRLQYTTFEDATSGPPVSVDALLTTDDGQFYGGNGFQVLGISGTRGSQALSFDPATFNDEIFFPGNDDGDYVDSFGIDLIAGGITYNLYKNPGSFAYQEFDGSTVRIVFDDAISLSPVQGGGVPEPASWAMMIGGVGLVGGTLRSRGRRTRTSAA